MSTYQYFVRKLKANHRMAVEFYFWFSLTVSIFIYIIFTSAMYTILRNVQLLFNNENLKEQRITTIISISVMVFLAVLTAALHIKMAKVMKMPSKSKITIC